MQPFDPGFAEQLLNGLSAETQPGLVHVGQLAFRVAAPDQCAARIRQFQKMLLAFLQGFLRGLNGLDHAVEGPAQLGNFEWTTHGYRKNWLAVHEGLAGRIQSGQWLRDKPPQPPAQP